jgi:Homeodomain-like domain
MAEFDLPRRERLLALLKVGLSVEEACADAGINPATVWRWRTRGLAPEASAEAASFAERMDAVRAATAESEREERADSEEEPLVDGRERTGRARVDAGRASGRGSPA